MIQECIHVGVTVSDMDRSLKFYQEVLGFAFIGDLLMEGEATDRLFRSSGCRVRVAYLKPQGTVSGPVLELLQFMDGNLCKVPADLRKTCISEICFKVTDLEAVYAHLKDFGVDCLSEPQEFDFTSSGFGRSKALYFRDPDGIILELMECLK